jgi:O-antigen ligase
MLCSVPMAFYYIKHRFGIKRIPYFFIAAIAVLMFTNGRSGGIIIMVETLIMSAILYPSWLKVLKVALIPLVALFFILQADSVQPYLNGAAAALESINPRLAGMLQGEGSEGNLKMDKSWLERKLQVEKGIEIIHDYPLLGVGPGNYSSYDARLDNLISYERLSSATRDYYNTRSAHNSYIMLMGEFGLLGLGIFLLLQGIGMFNLFYRIFKGQINESHLPLVSLLGLSMHFYAIVAIVGSITWFTLGTAMAVCTLSFRKS